MATLESFVADVRSKCPHAPVPLVHRALHQTVIDFCENTNIYMVPLRGNAVEGQTYFDLTVPQPLLEEINQVRKVWYKTNPRPLAHSPINGIDTQFALFSPIAGDSAPKAPPRVWYEIPGQPVSRVGVFYAPDETLANAFTTYVALKPLRVDEPSGADFAPDVLARDWYDAIVAGAVSRVRSIPDQAYTGDSNGPSLVYERKKLDARVQADRGVSPGDMSVQMQPFAFGSRQWR